MDTSSHCFCRPLPAAALLLACAVSTARSAEIVDLGTESAQDINESGQVVGRTFYLSRYWPALWPSGSATPRLVLTGSDFISTNSQLSAAWGINEQGEVTGASRLVGAGEPRAFLWANYEMTDLGAPAFGRYSMGRAINDAGHVAGAGSYDEQGFYNPHAVLWKSATMQNLGTFGGTASSAVAINASGRILIGATGFSAAPDYRAFLWGEGGEPLELVSALPDGISEPAALNDLDQAVGYSQADGYARATLWQGGRAVVIGADGLSTFPRDINNRGQVVGYTSLAAGDANFAFLWQNGRLHDLCALVDCANGGWTFLRANALNDLGDIVGTGKIGGQDHAFHIRGLAEPYAAGRYVTFTYGAGLSLVTRLRTPAATGAVAVERVKSTTGVAMANLTFFRGGGHSGRQVVALPNIAGSFGSDDLAVLATRRSDGYSRVELRDGGTGELIKTINVLNGGYIPVWLFEMPDLDNDSKADLGLLAVRASDGRLAVKLVGSVSGAGIGSLILYTAGLTPVMAAALPDLDNSGAPEIAVLAEKPDTGRFLVQIRNASGIAATRTIYFTDGYDPIDFRIGPDADLNALPEVTVLMRRRADRRVFVEMRNAFGVPAPRRLSFSDGYEAVGFDWITSTDPDSAPEWVVGLERVADGRPYTQLKNAYGPANTKTTAYHNTTYAVQQVLVLPDSDGIGGPDIAVVGQRKTDGRVRVEIQNARGGGTTRAFFFAP